MNVSVLILTYQEAKNIGDCLRSVPWSDDVVVLDSYSDDNTAELARELGARVVLRVFDNYASQRNFGLSQIQYRNPWVLMLDADERVPADLRDEIKATIEVTPDNVCMYRLRRRDHLYGKWIRRSSGYPTWFGRLARIGRVWLERPINEEFKTNGDIARLCGHLDHFPFNNGFHEWIAKHDRYSTMEAELLASGGTPDWNWRDLYCKDPLRRRAALKRLLYVMPARPVIVFALLFILRGGFLEGQAGLTFCALRAWYEFMINCKLRELKRRKAGLSI